MDKVCTYVLVRFMFVGWWSPVSLHRPRLFFCIDIELIGVVEFALEGSFFRGAGLDVAIGRYALLLLREVGCR